MATTWLRHESATVKLVHWNKDVVSLTNLYSKERRKGHATELMKIVCQLADNEGFLLQLVPGRYGHPIGPDNAVLIKFYESFGFKLPAIKDPAFPKIMTRRPNV